MKPAFKIGDKVQFADPECVGIAPAALEYPKQHRVTAVTPEGEITGLDASWDNGGWSWSTTDFILTSRAGGLAGDVYTCEGDSLLVGETEVVRAKRRTNGKVGYIIKRAGSSQNLTAVLQEDLLALAAVLADIDSGDIVL